jgi:MATE family multidrug resistance protein
MSVIQISSAAFMPSFALASAGAILVGQAIGAGRKDEVAGLVRLTFLSAATWQSLVGLVCLAVPALLLAPFARDPSTAAELLHAATRMLRLSVAWALFDAAAATLTEALRAAGDTAWALWARIVIAWAIFAPGSWLTVAEAGAHADLLAVGWLVLYLGLLAGALLVRFRSGAWRRIALLEPAAG